MYTIDGTNIIIEAGGNIQPWPAIAVTQLEYKPFLVIIQIVYEDFRVFDGLPHLLAVFQYCVLHVHDQGGHVTNTVAHPTPTGSIRKRCGHLFRLGPQTLKPFIVTVNAPLTVPYCTQTVLYLRNVRFFDVRYNHHLYTNITKLQKPISIPMTNKISTFMAFPPAHEPAWLWLCD